MGDRRQKWVMRQELEAKAHDGVGMLVTLTFAWHSLPDSEAEAKATVQGFIKRLRRWIEYYATREDLARLGVTAANAAGLVAGQFRFFGAIERGKRGTRRLHAHLNFFGLAPATKFGGFTMRKLIEKSWQGRGFVQVKPFRAGAARYVAKYVTKSPDTILFSKGGPSGLGALGAVALPSIAAGHDASAADIDRKVVTTGGRFFFLDKYLAERLRKLLGFTVERIADLARARLREAVARARERRWREVSADLGLCGPAPVEFRRYWATAL